MPVWVNQFENTYRGKGPVAESLKSSPILRPPGQNRLRINVIFSRCQPFFEMQHDNQGWGGEPRAKGRVNVILRCFWGAAEPKVFRRLSALWKFRKNIGNFDHFGTIFWKFSKFLFENFRFFQKLLKVKKKTDCLYKVSFLSIEMLSTC